MAPKGLVRRGTHDRCRPIQVAALRVVINPADGTFPLKASLDALTLSPRLLASGKLATRVLRLTTMQLKRAILVANRETASRKLPVRDVCTKTRMAGLDASYAQTAWQVHTAEQRMKCMQGSHSLLMRPTQWSSAAC